MSSENDQQVRLTIERVTPEIEEKLKEVVEFLHSEIEEIGRSVGLNLKTTVAIEVVNPSEE